MPSLKQNLANPAYELKHRLLTRAPFLIPILAWIAPLLRRSPRRLRRWLLRSQTRGMEEEYAGRPFSALLIPSDPF